MKRRSSLDPGFDRWLHRQLHDIYDEVLQEAVPDEISRLLEQFDGQTGPKKDEGPKKD